MGRITKRDKEGVAFWNGTNGLSYSDNEGNIYGEAISKLADYADAEEQGRLIKLPCAIGDTVWYIPSYNGNPLGFINKDKVQMIGFTSRGIHFKLREHHEHNKMYMLDKTVFLTREEVEKKLKEMESGN